MFVCSKKLIPLSSLAAAELISKMLVLSARNRINIIDVANHPWVTNNGATSTPNFFIPPRIVPLMPTDVEEEILKKMISYKFEQFADVYQICDKSVCLPHGGMAISQAAAIYYLVKEHLGKTAANIQRGKAGSASSFESFSEGNSRRSSLSSSRKNSAYNVGKC